MSGPSFFERYGSQETLAPPAALHLREYLRALPSRRQTRRFHWKDHASEHIFLSLHTTQALFSLHNQVVALDARWGHFAAELRDRLHDAPTIQARFALFEQFLLARLSWAPGLDLVQYALGEITQHRGALSIRTLSEQLGISQNHLNTPFKRLIGTSPKELARLSRFFHVLRSIDLMQPVDWTLIAHQAGSYDQSRCNKDFVTLTGSSPTDYLRLRRRLWAQNPQQRQSLGQLPIE